MDGNCHRCGEKLTLDVYMDLWLCPKCDKERLEPDTRGKV